MGCHRWTYERSGNFYVFSWFSCFVVLKVGLIGYWRSPLCNKLNFFQMLKEQKKGEFRAEGKAGRGVRFLGQSASIFPLGLVCISTALCNYLPPCNVRLNNVCNLHFFGKTKLISSTIWYISKWNSSCPGVCKKYFFTALVAFNRRKTNVAVNPPHRLRTRFVCNKCRPGFVPYLSKLKYDDISSAHFWAREASNCSTLVCIKIQSKCRKTCICQVYLIIISTIMTTKC